MANIKNMQPLSLGRAGAAGRKLPSLRRAEEYIYFISKLPKMQVPGELAMAAAVYAVGACSRLQGNGHRGEMVICWPFVAAAYEPLSPLEDLVRARDLISAEIKRLKEDCNGR